MKVYGHAPEAFKGRYSPAPFKSCTKTRIEGRPDPAHDKAVALHFAYYNFVRIHKMLRVTTPMAVGVTDRLWEMSDLVAIVEAAEARAKPRGPYKKRTA